MPITPTYPGVYVEEIPSGVRTITGVSTSVTAFAGKAKSGTIGKAVRVQSFADYERRFGGLVADSEMGYAVRQFFLNGGSDAYVVRLAADAQRAEIVLNNDPPTGTTPLAVLRIKALDAGFAGNNLEVQVDHPPNDENTFNLTINYYANPEQGDPTASERQENLSMNSQSNRYVETVVRNDSSLVEATREASPPASTVRGTSESAPLSVSSPGAPNPLIDAGHNRLLVSVNGQPPVAVTLTAATGNLVDQLGAIRAAIENQVRQGADPTNTARTGFAVTIPNNNRLRLTSGEGGENSSVHVIPGGANDASTRLKFGKANGGSERSAVGILRPREEPHQHGTLTGAPFADASELQNVPDADHVNLQIALDGAPFSTISIPQPAGQTGTTVTPASGTTVEERLQDIAGRIEEAVRNLKPGNAAYTGFTATVANSNALKLTSGTAGAGSAVAVARAATKEVAERLRLLTEVATNTASAQAGQNAMLTGGDETAYTDETAYATFVGSRDQRTGIFALEGVDLFNMLCLPGITDAGIIADAVAYCEERRAFVIVDSPTKDGAPATMLADYPNLPKSDHAAVYYPWIQIPDPLAGGRLRLVAPSGTVAGLYARTDATRGVWKAPAGTEATLNGVQALGYALNDRENGTLNPLGINALRIFPVFGPVSWGARTLRGADQMADEYKYVPIRRLALMIEETLYRSTQWVVFEPNDEPLWAQIRLNIGAFMNDLFRQGAFQGKTPREAYLVKCDKETTTQSDINRGVVNILVGFAPLKPAEFVFIRIQQLAGQIQT
jgi:phage tail sheath protein FI